MKGKNIKVSQIIRKIKIFNTGDKPITAALCMAEKYKDLKLLKTMSFLSTDEFVELLLFSIGLIEIGRTFFVDCRC